MIGDYDDDAHFCLKCQITVIGLDNYVAHRKAGCSKTVDLPKSPLPSQLLPPDDSFNLKADDFFSSLELQSSSKKLPQPQPSTSGKSLSGILTRSKTTAAIQASTSKEQEIPQSKSGKHVWIGGHQLKLGYGDNQTKLFKAVDDLERRKEELPEIGVFEESDVESEDFDYEEDESSDEENHDAPPRNHTGGKWKPSSPIDWNVPAPSYTGGKWKPSKPSPPPPTHTKGKWKPIEEEEKKQPKIKKEDFDVPSPSYTKGKWIPQQEPKKSPSTKITDDSPLRKSSGMVQYWCRPCNRRLSCKISYERHIKSELHYKRTTVDKEFDDLSDKPIKKIAHIESLPKSTDNLQRVKKRNRKTIFIKCEVCNSRVKRNSMGKHLISHYHCRKGDIYTVKAQIMALEYIGDIIVQSPFQCAVCKFYFNHHKDLLDHWLSEMHAMMASTQPGYFWCNLCQTKADTSQLMYEHLIGEEHEEVVAVINRSVPIIIKKLNPLKCTDCNKEFLLNVALAKHCLETGHHLRDEVSNFGCDRCTQIFRSNVGLQVHKRCVHDEHLFVCTVCNKNFNSKEEAKLHRNSKEHRYKIAPETRKCDYCYEIFDNLPLLKDHLNAMHKDYNSKCYRCGAVFTIPQELTVHLRFKSCSFKNQTEPGAKSCDKCRFSTTSQSELIFHKLLHTPPTIVTETGKPVEQYNCPFCEKMFPKASIQCHLRLHTNERPYVCQICKKSFVRKNNWALHVKNHSGKKREEKLTKDTNKRKFLCATCGSSFKKRYILKQHMSVHLGKMYKCTHPGCLFSARTMAELKRHSPTHSDEKNFECQLCDYKGKSLQQLKRHLTIHTGERNYACDKCTFTARTKSHLVRHSRLHTGAKPYGCPHCDYRCNSLENLRKHVLSTTKHKGKSIYECNLGLDCQFQTNFAKDFKVHLMSEHGDVAKNGAEALRIIARFYEGSGSAAGFTLEDQSDRPTVIVVPQQLTSDPLVAAASDDANMEEMLPTFVVSKDENAADDTWNVVGSYDVEESGALVPFNSESFLFQGHFLCSPHARL